jgi:hypothetical protein
VLGRVAEVRYIAEPTSAGAPVCDCGHVARGKDPYGLPEAAACSNPWVGSIPGGATTDTDKLMLAI